MGLWRPVQPHPTYAEVLPPLPHSRRAMNTHCRPSLRHSTPTERGSQFTPHVPRQRTDPSLHQVPGVDRCHCATDRDSSSQRGAVMVCPGAILSGTNKTPWSSGADCTESNWLYRDRGDEYTVIRDGTHTGRRAAMHRDPRLNSQLLILSCVVCRSRVSIAVRHVYSL